MTREEQIQSEVDEVIHLAFLEESEITNKYKNQLVTPKEKEERKKVRERFYQRLEKIAKKYDVKIKNE